MRRGMAVSVGLMVMTFGVVVASVSLGGGGPAARVGQVVCSQDGARAVTPTVLAGAGGLRLQVVNVGADRRYEVVSLVTPSTDAEAGILPADGVLDLELALPPGEVEFACLRARTGERLVTVFELQDPAELWEPEALACDDPDSGVFETDLAEEPFEDTARRALPGLLGSDVLKKPGYPETRWHGELHVVVRDEVVVGRVVRVLNHGTWNLSVDSCPGSGLTRGAVAETGAT